MVSSAPQLDRLLLVSHTRAHAGQQLPRRIEDLQLAQPVAAIVTTGGIQAESIVAEVVSGLIEAEQAEVPVITPAITPDQPLADIVSLAGVQEIDLEEKGTKHPPFLVSPITTPSANSIHMITVVMRASGDKTRDVLRMRRIHWIVMSYPGDDRFAFQVYERGQGYLVEFPNFSTGMCSELVAKLQKLVGTENVRIESITFH